MAYQIPVPLLKCITKAYILTYNFRMEIFDLRITVDSISGRSVCGLKPGDYFEVTNSAELRIPNNKHFCMYAIASVLPLLPAKQRKMAADDWLEHPEEKMIMKIERIRSVNLKASDLT